MSTRFKIKQVVIWRHTRGRKTVVNLSRAKEGIIGVHSSNPRYPVIWLREADLLTIEEASAPKARIQRASPSSVPVVPKRRIVIPEPEENEDDEPESPALIIARTTPVRATVARASVTAAPVVRRASVSRL